MNTENLTADEYSHLRHLFAPTGKLRVGLYPGSPNSYIAPDSSGAPRGVGYALGQAFAAKLKLAFEPVIYQKNGDILAAAQRGEIDFLLANATPIRAAYLAFTEPVLKLDLGYLVGNRLKIKDIETIDQININIGVSAASTSEMVLPGLLKHAQVCSVHSLKEVLQQMRSGAIDAFATNKAILFELADQLAGSDVLADAWGVEKISIGIPHERRLGLPYLQNFTDEMQRQGFIKRAAIHAGIRGLTREE